MSLIHITRDNDEYYINSSLATINKFTDQSGNEAYMASVQGWQGTLWLTAEEYAQFNSDNNSDNTEE